MDSSRHPFRKFVFSAIAKSGDGLYYTLTGARFGRSIRLEPSELELARLFDGSRDGATIRKAALEVLGIDISVAELEGFANELAINDLLVPGVDEPLPVPSQTDGESANLGWSKVGKAAGGGPETVVPSTSPGSLTGAGFPGSLTGLVGAFRGVVAAPSLSFNPSLLLPIGMLLNLPMVLGAVSMLVLLAAVFGTVAVMYTHRIDMGVDFLRLMEPWKLVLSFLGCIYLANFLSEIARAAAIATLTRTKPLFGVVFALFMIPRFYTHTGGASEAAPRSARLRIVGAAIVAQLSLLVISVGVWLVFRHAHGLLSSLAVMMAMVSSLLFYVQANPLMKRDGYYWLVQWFNAADIREQSFYSLFGYARPWYEGKKLPTGVLITYGVLSLLYVAWVITWILIFPGVWLKSSYGPVGVVIVLLIIGASIVRSTQRAKSGRTTIGPGKVKLDMPGRGEWIVVALLSGIALFPYAYEPSGVFTVMPNARAEIRALTQGAVKEVLVKEGEVVTAGQVIARISDEEQRAAVASSKATIAKLQANLKFSKLGGKSEEVEQVKQQIATLQKKLDFSRAEANRLGAAFRKKAISDQENQRALSVAELDQQNLLEARKRLALVISPARSEQLQAIEAEIARAEAELELNSQNLANTEIRAPIGGSIVSGTLRYAVGDYLQRGQQLATVEDTAHLMVQIRMSETDIGEIAVGNKGFARPWAFPSGGYHGVIREIAPAADASDYGKVVRVLMSIDETDGRLLPEMTGYAKVSATTYPLIVSFTRPLTRFVLVEVWSWLP